MKRTLAAPLAAATLLVAALTGCSTGSTSADAASEPTSTTSVDPDAFPVTIEHALGETTIEAEPTRVATLGWTDQDHVLALGVVPVGATKITWGGNDNG
jgi:iron complex transport system substrate-binding protein